MTKLRIGPDLGISAASGLRERLLKPLRAKTPVTISIERIDQLHSASLQVLTAFVRDRAAAQGATHIDAPDELRAAACMLGIDRILGLSAPAKDCR